MSFFSYYSALKINDTRFGITESNLQIQDVDVAKFCLRIQR